MKILELTLKRKWFDMIASGEKREEYREPKQWILSRLEGKTYDCVRFRNGYAPDALTCICEFGGWRLGCGRPEWGGSLETQCVIIELGRVLPTPIPALLALTEIDE